MSDLDQRLLAAAEAGDLVGVQAAIAAGANVHMDRGGPLHVAAEGGHRQVVQYLLDAGADVHAYNDYALQVAARCGHFSVVICLLEAGAHVHTDNHLAMRWAMQMGQVTIVRALREHGAGLQPLLAELHTFSPDAQAASLSTGDITAIRVQDLARQGVCPSALCVLIERQGRGELASMLRATQLLEPMVPTARAGVIAEFLAQVDPYVSLRATC